jgi:hypothetical protein
MRGAGHGKYMIPPPKQELDADVGDVVGERRSGKETGSCDFPQLPVFVGSGGQI